VSPSSGRLSTRSSANRGFERYRRAASRRPLRYRKALNILISFLSVPLTIHYLGSERYGVWLTISSLLTWMALTDLACREMRWSTCWQRAVATIDMETARQYVSSAFWVLTCISLVSGAAAIISFHWISWRTVFQVSAATSTHELNVACAMTLAIFILGFPLSLEYAIYGAYQDGYMANVWSIATNALALLALVIVSRFHGGLPQLVFAMAGTRTLVALANGVYLSGATPGWFHTPRPYAWGAFGGSSNWAASTWSRSWLRSASTRASQ